MDLVYRQWKQMKKIQMKDKGRKDETNNSRMIWYLQKGLGGGEKGG